MNSTIRGENITNQQQAIQMISQVQFEGITPLGTALEERIIRPLVLGPIQNGSLRKPVLIISITDGEPTGEASKHVFNVISSVKRASQFEISTGCMCLSIRTGWK